MNRNWTKEQIQKEIEEMDGYLPIKKIEEKLGMPPTTLQKVLKGERSLPKKWVKVLDNYFGRNPEIKPKDTSQTNTAKPIFESKFDQLMWETEREQLKNKK